MNEVLDEAAAAHDDHAHETVRSGGIGASVIRKEDRRFLTGQGCYSDDVNLPDQAYAYVIRSRHAHARIGAIDASEALAFPGVLGVLTGEDQLADGLKPIPHIARTPTNPPDVVLVNRDGQEPFTTSHFPLAVGKVRYVGEAVAVVIAESLAVAIGAAELVVVDYQELAAVISAADAALETAPRIWDEARSNVCIDAETGQAEETAKAFAAAEHIVRLESNIQRVIGVPMEPRAAVGTYSAATGRYTIYAGSSGAFRQKIELAMVFGVTPDTIRVVCQDVGGNFGSRNALYPEFVLALWASKRFGRPVKWTCERHESFLCDYHGRDLNIEAELALDKDGVFLGLRASLIGNLGAHTASFVAIFKTTALIASIYRIPVAHVFSKAVLTNTSPTHPYRSTGRPEAMFIIERLIDLAALKCGFDRVELRRRNLLRADELPYTNYCGLTYDSGEYACSMAAALKLIRWDSFETRRMEARKNGRLLGIGIANYIEVTSGAPREYAKISVFPDGRAEFAIGTISSGQGHETSFAQLITEWLGIPTDRIKMLSGDTDVVPVGGGSHSGRSMRYAGIVIGDACRQIIERGKTIAAHVLEVAESDLQFEGGCFVVSGTDRTIGLFEVSAAAARENVPENLRGPLEAVSDQTYVVAAFPYGSHACEAEVDPDTGAVELKDYAAVDDVGRAINPMILHGQTHGGATQGIGQALSEWCYYDPASGEHLSSSFSDYSMPKAAELPFFATELMEVPSPTNALGVRAGGEGGTTPALAVVTNAVVHALSSLGVEHIDMPATSQRVWRAINDAKVRCRTLDTQQHQSSVR